MADITYNQQNSESIVVSLKRNPSRPREIFNKVMTVLSSACICITLIPLFAVLIYVFIKGVSRLNLDLFTKLPPAAGQTSGGIGNAILGTIMVVAIASLIAVPFGVLAAVYLSEFSDEKTASPIRFATNVLSGVPSIIAGVFAYSLLVLSMGQFSAFAGGVALAVLMLPTIIRTTDEALQIVPRDIRWASVGVGASNYQTVLQIVLPAALPGIITGITLAIARAAGETAPLLFTVVYSNNWPPILSIEWVSLVPFLDFLKVPLPSFVFSQTVPSLAYLVYEFARSFDVVLQEFAWAGSLVLVLLVLITSILSRWATSQKKF
ncbi:phosphate ABC transporter permease PstA [Okeania sp. KiyG1]|uniref:phosphate ABC transporter permease PstA n=1 Tax=Okeania sp. KiyG1 TaxID=2720165 RepID=UPI00192111C9|nr:phosphate ABC transporter permease PstA [Okeania sp. KiyG1]GGA19714.1 phosphate transport system permease protein PstA [Okeania sp. KiyG1]